MVTDEMVEKAYKVINESWWGEKWGADVPKGLARRALEAALSAAETVTSRNDEAGYVEFLNEDVPYVVRDIQGAVAILTDLETRNVIGYRVYDPDSVFAPQPAPSVAVKDLEWERRTTISRCATITGTYHATFDKHEWQLSFQGVGKTASFNVSRHPNRSAAEDAAQTIHQNALSPYLSTQVQDAATFGPLAHLNGIHGLNEEHWTVTVDPHANDEETFSIPLYSLVDPFAAAPAKQEG